MKQLLLITAISCVCTSLVFAGSSCKSCPTAPAQQPPKDQTADADDVKKDSDKDAVKALLAASDSTSTMTPADDKNAVPTMPSTPDSTPTDGQMQPKFLLAGGSSPSTSDSNKKPETEADKAAQQKLLA